MSPSFLPDSSVLVAAAQEWHEHHIAARTTMQSRLAAGHQMLLAAHTLLETYSTLTRYPRGLSFPPALALEVIREQYVAMGTVVGLGPEHYIALLATLARQGITGGRVYDALIAATAREAGANVLLTFNQRHFHELAAEIDVVVPTAP